MSSVQDEEQLLMVVERERRESKCQVRKNMSTVDMTFKRKGVKLGRPRPLPYIDTQTRIDGCLSQVHKVR